jgi:hypothetical protein
MKTAKKNGTTTPKTRPFVALKGIGRSVPGSDNKGTVVGYQGRHYAPNELELSGLLIPLLKDLLAVARHKDWATFDEDVRCLHVMLNRLAWEGKHGTAWEPVKAK